MAIDLMSLVGQGKKPVDGITKEKTKPKGLMALFPDEPDTAVSPPALPKIAPIEPPQSERPTVSPDVIKSLKLAPSLQAPTVQLPPSFQSGGLTVNTMPETGIEQPPMITPALPVGAPPPKPTKPKKVNLGKLLARENVPQAEPSWTDPSIPGPAQVVDALGRSLPRGAIQTGLSFPTKGLAWLNEVVGAGQKPSGAPLTDVLLDQAKKIESWSRDQFPSNAKSLEQFYDDPKKNWWDLATIAADGVGENAPQLVLSLAATLAFGPAAGFVTTTGQETAEIFADIAEKTGKKEPGLSLGAGIAAGAVELPLLNVLTKRFSQSFGRAVAPKLAKEVLGSRGPWEIAKRVMKDVVNAGSPAVMGGLEEVAQTRIEKAALGWADDRYRNMSRENKFEMAQAGLIGFVTAGMIDFSTAAAGRLAQGKPAPVALQETKEQDVLKAVEAAVTQAQAEKDAEVLRQVEDSKKETIPPEIPRPGQEIPQIAPEPVTQPPPAAPASALKPKQIRTLERLAEVNNVQAPIAAGAILGREITSINELSLPEYKKVRKAFISDIKAQGGSEADPLGESSDTVPWTVEPEPDIGQAQKKEPPLYTAEYLVAKYAAKGFEKLGNFAVEAVKTGKKYAQYLADGVKQFGEKARAYLAQAWSDAKRVIQEGQQRRTLRGRTGGEIVTAPPPKKGPIFYSEVEQTINGPKFPSKIQGDAALNLLRKTPGVKPDEIADLGLEEFLRGKLSVTKQEIADHVKANSITVEEVGKAPDKIVYNVGNEDSDDYFGLSEDEATKVAIEDLQKEYQEWAEEYNNEADEGEELDDTININDIVASYDEDSDGNETVWYYPNDDSGEIPNWLHKIVTKKKEEGTTKFQDYQLPGGENYRELLLTLPKRENTSMLDVIAGKYTNYESPHFDEPNILAHVRFNERNDADGNKVLFLEEVQSDWAQEGRKKGFNDKSFGGLKKYLLDLEKNNQLPFPYSEEIARKIFDEKKSPLWKDYNSNGVPNMPFKDTGKWAMLAMKRMIRYAAENGFDKIAWTTGEQQADRYDLSKKITDLAYQKKGDNYLIFVTPQNKNEAVRLDTEPTAKELEAVVGKDLAKKILNNEGEPVGIKSWGRKRFSGLDLKVGGEGMKGFYDKILPSELKKYGKSFGVEVGETTMDTGKQPSIHITPKLKERALSGQPLYSAEYVIAKYAAKGFKKLGQFAVNAVKNRIKYLQYLKDGIKRFGEKARKVLTQAWKDAKRVVSEGMERRALRKRTGATIGEDYKKNLDKELGKMERKAAPKGQRQPQKPLKIDTPLLDFARENGRIMNPPKELTGEWDDAPKGKISPFYRQRLFGGTATPDQMAARMFERGLIQSDSVPEMWEKIKQEMGTRKKARAEDRVKRQEERRIAKEDRAKRLEESKEEKKAIREAAKEEKMAGRVAKQTERIMNRVKDPAKMRSLMVNAASRLPLNERGKMVGMIANAKSLQDFQDVLDRVKKLDSESARRSAVEKFKRVVGKVKRKKYLPFYQERIDGILKGYTPDKPETVIRAVAKALKNNPDIPDALKDRMDDAANRKNLNDTPIGEIEFISKMLEHYAKTSSKQYKIQVGKHFKAMSDLAQESKDFLEEKDDLIPGKDIDEPSRRSFVGYLIREGGANARTMFAKLGKAGEAVGNMLKDGLTESMRLIQSSEDTVNSFIKDDDFKLNTQGLEQFAKEKIEVYTTGGRKIKIPRGWALNIYAHSRTPYNRERLLGNGWKYGGDEGGKVLVFDEDNLEVLKRQVESDPISKGLVDGIFAAFNGEIKEAGNKAAIELQGHEIFTVDNYFPAAINRTVGQGGLNQAMRFGQATLENSGFTKARTTTKKALNGMDILDLYRAHTQQSANYAALAVPLREAKVFLGGLGADDTGPAGRNLGEVITEKLGEDYISDLRARLDLVEGMGFDEKDSGMKTLDKLIGNITQAYLMLPSGTALKVYGGIINAMGEMAPTSLIPNLGRAIKNRETLRKKLMENTYLRNRLESMSKIYLQRLDFLSQKERAGLSLKVLNNIDTEIAGAVYLTAKDEGLSDTDALARTEEVFRLTQNPSTPWEISNMAIRAKKNVVYRPWIYMQGEGTARFNYLSKALKDYQEGTITPENLARKAVTILGFATMFSVTAGKFWRWGLKTAVNEARRIIHGEEPEEPEDKEDAADKAKRLAWEIAREWTGMIPGGSTMAKALESAVTRRNAEFGGPVAQNIGDFMEGFGAVWKADDPQLTKKGKMRASQKTKGEKIADGVAKILPPLATMLGISRTGTKLAADIFIKSENSKVKAAKTKIQGK